jgi:hypothetical protein
MSRDILDSYGRDTSQPQAAPTRGGGKVPAHDVNSYQPPKGPSNIGSPQSPGLHGTNHGCCGSQGKY